MHVDLVAIDGGNTHLKLGWFMDGILTDVHRVDKLPHLEEKLSLTVPLAVANVGSFGLGNYLNEHGFTSVEITNALPLPFKHHYKTPTTLGIDRLCNMAAAQALHPNTDVLVMDLGTCIKIDFIDAHGVYQGGTISPGCSLRFKSLNDYTANLPLLTPEKSWELAGNSTQESLIFGIMGSVQAELEFYISAYSKKYQELIIYLTGGDAHYFDFGQKKSIFVDENLTLKGIYALYRFQNS